MALGVKALPWSKTLPFKECLIPLSLSFQMYWLNVAFLLFCFLKLCLWPLNLALNVFSMSPRDVLSLLFSLFTVAWYIMLDVLHCPFCGHIDLHGNYSHLQCFLFFCLCLLLFLLCLDIICFTFGIQK